MSNYPRRDVLAGGAVVVAGLAGIAALAGGEARAAPAASKPLRRFVIERDVPGIGTVSAAQMCSMAQTSDNALAQLAPHIQWEHSYLADNKSFCVYLAEDEDAIRKHGELSGFPVTKITPIDGVIDPTTALGKQG